MKVQYSPLLKEMIPVGQDILPKDDIGLSVILFHAQYDPPFVRWIENLVVDFMLFEDGYDFIYIVSGKRQKNYLQKLITNDIPKSDGEKA